ncbi:molybdopterin-synthase adenylyltransferase MoeB [Cognatishimia sp. SS12]|uniref:HesA/MoeB/ThiF family protein n=1 Tax=Cognatishimia sp. SS12 TaxID=2979465 RepID=UPI00232BB574|nr:molybdopterin-synthase adenylyltransferase MoeB [Cognatishimia sp. SS12]MDC0739006.1 molybdopterin-synthase adenylyltransferase MoeB [Cognatishimia sp. SS12]
MFFVFLIAAVLWGMGVLLKTPRSARYAMLGLLYGAVLLAHLVLPDGNALRLATGGSAAPWLLFGGGLALVVLYRIGLARLRSMAKPAETTQPAQNGPFSDTELSRYARHIVLHEVGGLGQKRLKDAKVLVIGAGGLGSPALMYLAAAGVGTIGVVDDDVVDNSNLQRQVIHKDANIGMPKVHSAAQAMRAQNPFVTVRPYQRRLGPEDAEALIADYDIVLDGCDNFDTRYLVNAACVAQGKPLASGAITQWEGQVSLFQSDGAHPCYHCVFPSAPAAHLAPNCAEAGVIGPLPGIIGTMMALEAIKHITGAGVTLSGEMLIYDGLYGETRKISLKKRPDCPTCGTPGGENV